jgi:Mor family transcriptional regulator
MKKSSMDHNLIVNADEPKRNLKPKHPVPALFEHLGIQGVKSSDSFLISYRDGLLEARVKRASGTTETAVKTINGNGFHQMTQFDPEQMTRTERNELIRNKYAKGERQTSLEKIFGLSQSMISKIVSKEK